MDEAAKLMLAEALAERAKHLYAECEQLKAQVRDLQRQLNKARARHQPVTFDWSASPKCHANHGVAWADWPCPDAFALGLGGEASDGE